MHKELKGIILLVSIGLIWYFIANYGFTNLVYIVFGISVVFGVLSAFGSSKTGW